MAVNTNLQRFDGTVETNGGNTFKSYSSKQPHVVRVFTIQTVYIQLAYSKTARVIVNKYFPLENGLFLNRNYSCLIEIDLEDARTYHGVAKLIRLTIEVEAVCFHGIKMVLTSFTVYVNIQENTGILGVGRFFGGY